ncbi:hypothetical protein JCM11491_005233 [Sporobolomyces phaffii]
MSSSTFPVEVMNEIFRSSELDHSTLANCCLLSKRYLDTARTWLYNSVSMVVVVDSKPVGRCIGPASRTIEYDSATWKLLVLLHWEPIFRQFIRLLKVRVTYSTAGRSGVPTSVGHALANFLVISPRIRHLLLCGTRESNYNILVELTPLDLAQITHMTIDGVDEISVAIFSSLPQLEVLTVDCLDLESISSEYRPRNLRCLFVKNSDFHDYTFFLVSSASTLRELHLPLASLFSLSLVDYPNLSRLGFSVEPDLAMSDILRSKSFWETLVKADNIRNLTLDGDTLSPHMDSFLFGSWMGFMVASPPSLRRIEFTEAVPLERLEHILAAKRPIQIGIGRQAMFTTSAVKYQGILAMCQTAGVEVILLS